VKLSKKFHLSKKKLDFGFSENFQNGRIGVFEEWWQTGFRNPGSLCDVFFCLWGEIGRISVKHIEPPRMLEMPNAITPIAMVCDTYQISKFQQIDAGLLLNLSNCRDFNLFSSFLMPFWKIP
jgi:hypothetical protein